MADKKSVWFRKIDGSESEPLTAGQLRQLARDGELKRDDLVRRGDHDKWVRADRVKGLFKVVGVRQPQPNATVADAIDAKSESIVTAEIVPEQGSRTNAPRHTTQAEENSSRQIDARGQHLMALLAPYWTLVAITGVALSTGCFVVATMYALGGRYDLSRVRLFLAGCILTTIVSAAWCIHNRQDRLATWIRSLGAKPRLSVICFSIVGIAINASMHYRFETGFLGVWTNAWALVALTPILILEFRRRTWKMWGAADNAIVILVLGGLASWLLVIAFKDNEPEISMGFAAFLGLGWIGLFPAGATVAIISCRREWRFNPHQPGAQRSALPPIQEELFRFGGAAAMVGAVLGILGAAFGFIRGMPRPAIICLVLAVICFVIWLLTVALARLLKSSSHRR